MADNRRTSWTPFGPDRPSPGRVKGSRNRLNKHFFQALSEDFDEHGVATIARMRFTDPAAYIAVIAKLMPQRLEIETPTDGMSLDRLERMIELAERMQALNGTLPDADAPAMRIIDQPQSLSGNKDYRTQLDDKQASCQPERTTYEKADRGVVLEGRGGGPRGEEPHGGINPAPSTLSPPTENPKPSLDIDAPDSLTAEAAQILGGDFERRTLRATPITDATRQCYSPPEPDTDVDPSSLF